MNNSSLPLDHCPAPPDVIRAQEAQKMRMPDGRVVPIDGWYDRPLYSTIDVVQGWSDPVLNAFTYQVGDRVTTSSGSTARTATKRDTNMDAAGALGSADQAHMVYGIRCHIYEFTCSQADVTTWAPSGRFQPIPPATRIATLQAYLKLAFIISNETDFEAGLEYFNSGMGVSVGGLSAEFQATAADQDPQSLGNAGEPGHHAVRAIARPITLLGETQFRLALQNPHGVAIPYYDEGATPAAITGNTTNNRFVLYLDGLHKRRDD